MVVMIVVRVVVSGDDIVIGRGKECGNVLKYIFR